ncbi:MAG: oligoendopeptidase [Actinomycetia bacterium]|nr:oligoendopeptidase [Actinomycetes bacterium]
MVTSTELTAQDVAWDLEPLLPESGEAGVLTLLEQADALADELSAKRGQVASFDADALVAFMQKSAELSEAIGRAGSYASLRFATDTTDAARGALMQKVRERATVIATKVLFFELEWAALDDAQADALLADERLSFAAHHLRSARRYRPHLLSEPEEVVLAEKEVTGASAFERLFEEQVSSIMVSIDGETLPLDAGLARLQSPDRDARRTTAEAITESLLPGLRTRGFVFNTLLADKAVDDRLRRFPSWVASRNLDNEASDESVQALVDAVQGRYDIPQRWYRLKAGLLGIDRLADYDRLAPLDTRDSEIGWNDARDLVLDAYGSFSPELAGVAQRFFDEPWIDAPARPGKRPGAFCAYTVPSHHPYVMLNWTSRRRDVLTLAHELGHGAHAYLAREQGVFHQGTPLTLAETASVFGETVTFGRLLSETSDPEGRLALLASNLEDQIATVFRQIAMNRFEDAVHNARRDEGEISIEQFGDLWYQTQHAMLGDAVELTDGYRNWWSYIPHFMATPGYVYAYAYGQLLALSVYARYEEHGPDFVSQYLDLLRAGGSKTPQELGELVDVDLADPGFWDAGLAIIDRRLAQTEEAARAAGRM